MRDERYVVSGSFGFWLGDVKEIQFLSASVAQSLRSNSRLGCSISRVE